MQKHDLTTFISGAVVAAHDAMNEELIVTGIKGVIGGACGYAGKLIVVWCYDTLKQKLKQKKTNNKNQP